MGDQGTVSSKATGLESVDVKKADLYPADLVCGIVLQNYINGWFWEVRVKLT